MNASISRSWANQTPTHRSRTRGRFSAKVETWDAYLEVDDGFISADELLEEFVTEEVNARLPKARMRLAEKQNFKGLARLRMAAGMSQTDLADAVGTSQPRLSRWEARLDAPSTENLRALRDALQCSFDELLDSVK